MLQPQSQTWISYSSLGEVGPLSQLLKLWAEDSWTGDFGELRLEVMAAFRLLNPLACSGTSTTKCCFFCTKHECAATLTEWLEPSFVMWEMMKLLILLFAWTRVGPRCQLSLTPGEHPLSYTISRWSSLSSLPDSIPSCLLIKGINCIYCWAKYNHKTRASSLSLH